MADTWNQAAEAQELTESVQRLVKPRKNVISMFLTNLRNYRVKISTR